MNQEWQLQEAKNRLSQVLSDALEKGPQTITVHGKPKAVVVSMQDYRRLSQAGGSLVEFLMNSPLRETDFLIERSRDTGREIDL